MTKAEVVECMGERIWRDWDGDEISNPYRTESAVAKDGTPLEVLFYYTDVKRRDGAITDDELTPVVLKSNRVIGWGWSFLGNVSKYEIRLR
jgi:hypothetical protein